MKSLLPKSTIPTVLAGVAGVCLMAASAPVPDVADGATSSEPGAKPSAPGRLASASVVDAGRRPVPIDRAPNPPLAAKLTPSAPLWQDGPTGDIAMADGNALASEDDRAQPAPAAVAEAPPELPTAPSREWMAQVPGAVADIPGQRFVIVLEGGPPPMTALFERREWERYGGSGKHRRKKGHGRDR